MSEKKDPSKSPRDTNGPVVKTGPTSGNNRSRNDDGAWRKKRSDAGESKKKSGCFLTTAACMHKGLPDDCYELETLRRFRDDYLLSTSEGVIMVKHYYFVAPEIAERLVDRAELEHVWEVVCRCVDAIGSGRNEEAKCMYMQMVHSLEDKCSGNLT